ncbi:MAG: hypothetical protein ACLR8Y_15845 [Alistipes indistinctus]
MPSPDTSFKPTVHCSPKGCSPQDSYRYAGASMPKTAIRPSGTKRWNTLTRTVVRSPVKCTFPLPTAGITYYVYDDLGQAALCTSSDGRYVRLFDGQNGAGTWLYCYYTEYDDRGNVVRSQTPGAEYTLSIYDRRGRLAMSQDGNQRANGQWSFVIRRLRPPCSFGRRHGRNVRVAPGRRWKRRPCCTRKEDRPYTAIRTGATHPFPMRAPI